MVTLYGMNETIGQRTYAPPPSAIPETTEREIDIAVRNILAKAFDRATTVLRARRADLDEGG
jgi:cell division protease FtsH